MHNASSRRARATAYAAVKLLGRLKVPVFQVKVVAGKAGNRDGHRGALPPRTVELPEAREHSPLPRPPETTAGHLCPGIPS
jgi:hypothetical protein